MQATRTTQLLSQPVAPKTVPTRPTPKSKTRFKFSTEWLDSSVVRISATGDIDALSAGRFSDYISRHAANSRHLIIDLQNVDFFAASGFWILRKIDTDRRRAGVTWTLVSSKAVSRILDICDPHRKFIASR